MDKRTLAGCSDHTVNSNHTKSESLSDFGRKTFCFLLLLFLDSYGLEEEKWLIKMVTLKE